MKRVCALIIHFLVVEQTVYAMNYSSYFGDTNFGYNYNRDNRYNEDQGVSYGLINKLLPLENVEVCLVSYVGPKTPAGKLKKGAKHIRTSYGTTKVLAKVNVFDIFSDHPDIEELMKWLSNQDSTTKIFLVHGEKEILDKALTLYKQKGFVNTKIAVAGNNILN